MEQPTRKRISKEEKIKFLTMLERELVLIHDQEYVEKDERGYNFEILIARRLLLNHSDWKKIFYRITRSPFRSNSLNARLARMNKLLYPILLP